VALAAALRARGYSVDLNVGQSKFRCDLAVRLPTEPAYRLGILLDTDAHYANPNLLDRYVMQPAILRAFGWRFALVLAKDWFHHPDDVLNRVERMLRGDPETPLPDEQVAEVEARQMPAAASPPVLAPTSPELTRTPTPTPVEAHPPVPPAAGAAPISATPPSPPAGPSATRYFEFVGGGSSKFWEVTLTENTFSVRYGRIGAQGQTQSKTFPDPARAQREMAKLIEEKLKKGYEEKPGRSGC
jgi:predicted DNA-binding WGR domain protein